MQNRPLHKLESELFQLVNYPHRERNFLSRFQKIVDEIKSERSIPSGDPERVIPSLDARDENDNSILRDLFVHYNKEAIEVIVKAGANINNVNSRGVTLLHSTWVEPERYAFIIDLKPNLNVADIYGYTPLMVAVVCCFYSAMQQLIAAKADLECKNKYSETALDCAIKRGNLFAIALLLKHKAIINDVEKLENLLYSQDKESSDLFFCRSVLCEYKGLRCEMVLYHKKFQHLYEQEQQNILLTTAIKNNNFSAITALLEQGIYIMDMDALINFLSSKDATSELFNCIGALCEHQERDDEAIDFYSMSRHLYILENSNDPTKLKGVIAPGLNEALDKKKLPDFTFNKPVCHLRDLFPPKSLESKKQDAEIEKVHDESICKISI